MQILVKIWSDFGQKDADFGQIYADFGQNEADFGQIWSDFGQNNLMLRIKVRGKLLQ